jgi:hypothetical protein
MVLFDLDAHLGHGAKHYRPHVLHRVLRRHREIAHLGADAVTEIAALIFRAGVDRQLPGVESKAGVVGVRRVADVVEHQALGLGAEKHGVADAHRLHHRLRLLGDDDELRTRLMSLNHLPHPDLVATEIETIGPGKFTSFLRERLRLQSHSFTPSEWCQAELAAEHRRHMLLRRETTIRSDVPHRARGCSK